jgi:hypothetical protein
MKAAYVWARKTLHASLLVGIIQEELMVPLNGPLDGVVPLRKTVEAIHDLRVLKVHVVSRPFRPILRLLVIHPVQVLDILRD